MYATCRAFVHRQLLTDFICAKLIAIKMIYGGVIIYTASGLLCIFYYLTGQCQWQKYDI